MFATKILKISAPLALLLGLIAVPSIAGADATSTITSVSETSTSVTLHWSSVDTDPSTPITQYQVNVLPISSGIGNSYNSNVYTGTVTGLAPDTTYQIQFVTITAAPPPTGADFIITQIAVTTKAAGTTTTTPTIPPTTIPTSPPTTRPVTTTTKPRTSTVPTIKSLVPAAHTIAVTWSAPTSIPQPISKYVLTALANNKIKRTVSANVSARRATLTGLAPHTRYTVVLAAKLKSGSSIEISGTITTK
jgi:hypothetical protein